MGTTVRRRFRRFIAVFLVLPAVAFSQDRAIVSMPVGECTLTVEANERWHTLRLRVRPETGGCRIEKEPMLSVLKSAFSKTDPPRMEGPYTSLSIGRPIDYAWLSRYLADAAAGDAGWVAVGGYRVISVTVEKVLVDRVRGLPFDAQAWFNLGKD